MIQIAPYENIAHFSTLGGISVVLLGDVDISALAEFLRLYPRCHQIDIIDETTELSAGRSVVASCWLVLFSLSLSNRSQH